MTFVETTAILSEIEVIFADPVQGEGMTYEKGL